MTETQRIDKWLWHARFFKTRSLAAKVVSAGVRVDGEVVSKTSRAIAPGQVITFAAGNRTRVVKVVALSNRRGPASEAQELYEDLSDPVQPKPERVGPRPTKKNRRDRNAFESEQH